MYFDTHAHYWDDRFSENGEDVDALIDRLIADGVEGIVNVGTDLDTSARAVEQARRHGGVMFAAAGIHPSDCTRYDDLPAAIDRLRDFIQTNRDVVVAIGEVGLDYHWEGYDPERQIAFFDAQLSLAEEMDLPVIVHDRDAHGDCLDCVRRHPASRGVFHSFSGSAETAHELFSLGWIVSFSGSVTFTNAHRLAAVAANLPHDKVMIETDCPYLTPHPHRGKRNDSGYLAYTAAALADLWGVSRTDVAAITSRTARAFFDLEGENR